MPDDRGYRMEGPVAVAQFEIEGGDEPELREARILRQRQANAVVLLADLAS